jgi:hypothetical protein
MKVFYVKIEGYKTVVSFISQEDFERFIDSVTDGLERLWVEVKEVGKQ